MNVPALSEFSTGAAKGLDDFRPRPTNNPIGVATAKNAIRPKPFQKVKSVRETVPPRLTAAASLCSAIEIERNRAKSNVSWMPTAIPSMIE